MKILASNIDEAKDDFTNINNNNKKGMNQDNDAVSSAGAAAGAGAACSDEHGQCCSRGMGIIHVFIQVFL
jgi:hypothetical protein